MWVPQLPYEWNLEPQGGNMRAVCVASYPDENQIRELGPDFYRNQSFGLVVGREYLILGLSYARHSHCGNAVAVSYFDGENLVLGAPIILFDITNPCVSRYWELKTSEDGSLDIYPPLFHEDFFHDRLSDNEQEASEAFQRVYALLDSEDKETLAQWQARR
jgi:hypothetical protein